MSSKMTIPVVIKDSGKVQGIKGLYISPETKRVYVRFSYHGIDKQVTIYPKNHTFSELNRAATKALANLKRSVLDAFSKIPQKESVNKSAVEVGIEELPTEISKHWSFKGRSQKYIDELIRTTKGLAICSKNLKKNIDEINKHNAGVALSVISNPKLSDCQKFKLFNGITICFEQLIQSGRHFGFNPTRDVPKPIYSANQRTLLLTFEDSAKVILAIRNDNSIPLAKKLEMELFFRLAVETGQRPKDIYMFNLNWIDEDGEHCQFQSHKTKRKQRVKHILSKNSKDLIARIIIARSGASVFHQKWSNKHGNDEKFDSFWRYCLFTYDRYLNTIIRSIINPDISLYSARHFFVSEIFKRTESEFWAEVFTHEGKNTNQRNYLHPEQKKADEILSNFIDSFDDAITKQDITNVHSLLFNQEVIH